MSKSHLLVFPNQIEFHIDSKDNNKSYKNPQIVYKFILLKNHLQLQHLHNWQDF